MSKLLPILLLALFFMAGCSEGDNQAISPDIPPDEWIIAGETRIPVYGFDGIEQFLIRENDTTYAINFWASWCKPCVEEMPYFTQVAAELKNEKFRLILVSLDFRSQAEEKMVPFINEYGIEDKVLLLDDPDANAWISRVDENWSGAIPATLIYKNGERVFHEGTLDYAQLSTLINEFLNKN